MNKQETIVLEGTVQTDLTKTYYMIPFDVPAHVVRMDVTYEYSAAIGSDPHLTGGNTVDIGLFDPRGEQFMTEGFRGWSGSARSSFYISSSDATPGYMPGPLQAGIWYICLGLYKIADDGCDYRVTVQLSLDDRKDKESDFPKRLELRSEAHSKKESGWYKGEFHCHTQHSDGDSTTLEVVRHAESLGLDFLAITDHNVLSQQISLHGVNTSLMLIPGMEVTTYKGHWNIWGAAGWVDFRVTSEQAMQQAVRAALEQGYLISCNHPKPYGPEWDYPNIAGFHCIEVWNGPWKIFNDVALTYWEEKLRAGERYTAIGGSDCHFLHREHHAKLGHPTSYVYIAGEPSPQAILDAVRAGHLFISEAPDGAQLFLEVSDAIMGDTITPQSSLLAVTIKAREAAHMQLEICGANGILHSLSNTEADWEATLEVDIKDSTYIRAQLVSETEGEGRRIHALTNPIYIQ